MLAILRRVLTFYSIVAYGMDLEGVKHTWSWPRPWPLLLCLPFGHATAEQATAASATFYPSCAEGIWWCLNWRWSPAVGIWSEVFQGMGSKYCVLVLHHHLNIAAVNQRPVVLGVNELAESWTGTAKDVRDTMRNGYHHQGFWRIQESLLIC